ncbi:MAG TPA: STAS domain-containing protein [Bryobacteraceae bacterium]|jgi:anti-sigma B factor antagonist|nr:STAS domain-containing protein [Bryobacteraceae bacterium]
MALTIGTRLEDGLAVLELSGSLSLGPSLVSLRNAAREALANPAITGIILDVARITSVDSSGLGELTIVYSSASRRNVPLRLVGVSSNLQKMLQMTHLDGVLQSAPELASAKQQLAAG